MRVRAECWQPDGVGPARGFYTRREGGGRRAGRRDAIVGRSRPTVPGCSCATPPLLAGKKGRLMQILFDKGSTQVQVHIETGHRLVTLFQAIKDQGWGSAIGPHRITRESLEGVNCLVILTRHRATAPGYVNPFPGDWDFAFMESELKAILDFNMAGGG